MKSFKKKLTNLLLITCFIMLAIYTYRYSLLNFAPPRLQSSSIKKTPLRNSVAAKKASIPLQANSTLAKAIKPRIFSEREKYEAFLNHHPFNNRVREMDDTEVEGEDREAREERKEAAENNPDRPDLAFEQDFLRTMDPALHRPTPEVLTDVIKKNHPPSLSDAITPRMPGDNTSVETNWKELGPNNVGGRTRALTWDPNTPNKVWAGGVTGGLWYNNDITSAASSWVNVSDLWANLAITKIAFDPANTQNIYVATGEGYQVNSSQGAGIWKSSDGGTSWTQLNATKSMTYINDLIVRNESGTGVVYAAIDGNSYNGAWSIYQNTGLYRSTNGGTSWSQVMMTNSKPPGTGAPYTPSSISIAADNRIWIGTKATPFSGSDQGGGKVLYSDNGTSWTIAKSVAVTNGFGRVSIATAPSNADYIYAFIEKNTSGGVSTISLIKSIDKGLTWSDLSLPDDADNDITASDFSRGQAWYDQVLKVDPTNAQTVYVGAIDLFKSTDEGTSWSQISKWANATGLVDKPYSIVHADQHAIEFKPGSSSEAIFGNDGGIFYSSDLTNAATTDVIAARNNNYSVTQFYSAAINPIAGSNGHMAGAQDNGTHKFTNNVINYANDVSGGDGGFCFIDQTDSLLQINSYVNNQFYLSRNGGKTINSFKQTKGVVLADANTGSFINPACYDNNQNAIYTYKSSAAGGGSIYLVKNITTVSTTLVPSTIAVTNLTSAATAFKISPYTTSSTTLFIGTSSGKLIKLTNANNTPVETNISGTSPNALPVGSISCIEIGRDEDELLVTFFNYGLASKIYYSSNGGTTWTSKMGNFPNMPVRWALFNPQHPATEVILATELGVYGTTNFNNASPAWTAKNTGFANVRTDMLQMRSSDNMVIAATHGRGLFSSMGFSAPTASVTAQPTCTSAKGTITVSSTLTGYSFSIDGATYSNTSGIFTEVAAGTYSVTSKNASNVISLPTSVTINPQPPIPAVPTFAITQPTCTLATGTITVSSSTSGLSFSIDGTDYSNTNGIFSSIASSTISLTTKNTNGCTSDATNVTVNAQPTPPSAPTASVSVQPTCTIITGTVALSGLPASGSWTVTATGGATITGTGTTGNFTGLAAGTYTFTVSNSSCTSIASASVTVNAQPQIPSAPTTSITQPTCTIATGTITVSSVTTGLTFSIDGTTYSNTTGIFSGLAAGTYNLTARNTSGCTSAATNVIMNAQPTTPSAPIASVSVQPTCSTNTGTVALSGLPASGSWTVTATGGATITGTGTTGNFTGLAAGAYTFTVSNSSCTSIASASVTVNAQPTPPSAPSATVSVQPTCTIVTGTVSLSGLPAPGSWTVTATGGATITGTGTTVNFTGLAAGTYTFTVSNSSCTSIASASVTVNAQPQIPSAPTTSITQPTCTTATGTITVSSATTGLTFSIDGTNYSNTTGIFNVLAAGNYNLTARNTSGCTSAATNVTVNAQPTTPSAPSASVSVQPTCSLATGTVALSGLPAPGSWTVTATGGATITGTGTTGNFTGLAAGAYTFTVSNSSCTSIASASVTVNAQPQTPSSPTTSITQPNCTTATGTITVSSANTGLTFSIDGTTYSNTTGIFTGLAAGNYNLTARNTSGCTSAATNVTVNAQPTTPSAPTTSITQPTCTTATGTITVSSANTGLTFSIDGTTYSNTTGIFTGLSAGAYNLTARNISGCTSTTTNITVNAPPATTNNTIAISSAAGSNNQTTCINEAIANITYATTGATGATFSGLLASVTGNWTNNIATISGIPTINGAFNYTITLTGGCGNITTTGTITAIPNNTITLSSSAGSDNQTNCTNVAIKQITYSTTGATDVTFSGLPSGVVGTWSANIASISGMPTVAGTYNYTITLKGGCGNITTTGTIIAKPIASSPTISASSTSFCPGGSMVLSSSASSGNQWFKDGVAITGANEPTYAANSIGSYSVSTFVNGCSSLKSAAKAIAPSNIVSPPIITASGATSFCNGGNVNLASNMTSNIQWLLNGTAITGATDASYTASSQGNYSVASVTSSGCTSNAITVNLLAAPNQPLLSATTSKTFCAGGNVTINSNETSGNQWYKDGSLIAGATGSSYTATLTGAFTDTIVNSNGCKTGSLPMNIIVKAAPAKPIISWNGSTLSTISPATSFQWLVNNVALFGATLSTYKPLTIGLYKIQITNPDGCTSISDSFNLVVTALNNPATTIITNLASVFPNPASPVLLVKFREAPNSTLDIQLITTDGRTIQMVKTKDKLTTIPINNVPSGKYYIRITGNNYNQTEGVIISK